MDLFPKQRVKTAAAAQSICLDLDRDDMLAACNRSDYWAAIDGEVPFNQAKLEEAGMPYASNFNDLTGDGMRNGALASYIDLTESVPHLADFDLRLDDESEEKAVKEILADEFDWVHEQWPFEEAVLRVADGFVVDGVCAAYWDNRWSPEWEVAKMSDFKFPRETKIGERNIETFKFYDRMSVGQLYDKIRNEEMAKKNGWNIEAVKKAIAYADLNYNPRQAWGYAWDKFQEAIKEGDLWLSTGSNYRKVSVDKLFVREYSGKYSLYIVPSGLASGGDFLCKKWSKFDSIEEILVTFTAGVGNGTYHSIRGLGWKMYPYLQAQNRLNNKMVDGTILAGSVVAQPKDAAAMEEFQMAQVGGFTFVRGDVAFPTIGNTNVATQILPVLNNLKQQLQNNTGRYQSRAVTPEGQERSATEVRLQASQEAVLSSSDMILFYRPLKRVYNEEWRRLLNPKVTARDNGGKLIFEFRKRLMKRGVNMDLARMVDCVRPVKAIGNGSASQRMQAQDRIVQLSSSFDEIGRQNAIYDAVAATPGVGYENAARYSQPPSERPPADDIHTAESENTSFLLGVPVTVLGTDNPLVHCQIHLDFLDTVAQKLEYGQGDPIQQITALNSGLDHTREHYQALALDMSRQPEAKRVKQAIQQLSAIAQQQSQRMAKQMRNGQGEQPQEIDPKFEQQIEQKEVLFEQKTRQKDRSAKQQLAINDAKAAQKLTYERLKQDAQRAGLGVEGNGRTA